MLQIHVEDFGSIDRIFSFSEEARAPSLWMPLRSSTGRVAGVMAIFILPHKDAEEAQCRALAREEIAPIVRLVHQYGEYFAGKLFLRNRVHFRP